MKLIFSQFILSVIMILSLIFLNFKDYEVFMNMSMSSQATSYIFVISFIIFISLFLFEEKGDERIQLHKNIADRLTLFILLLSLGGVLIYNYIHHMINFQILYLFILILVLKFIFRIYFYFKK